MQRTPDRASPGLRPIPGWVRAGAACFVMLSLVAAVLTVRDGARHPAGSLEVLQLVPQVVLGVCLAALFAYVAATGRPPTHLWRAAGASWWGDLSRQPLHPDLAAWLARLRERHPRLREVWVLRPAAWPPGTQAAAWRFIAFADQLTLDAVRADWDIRRRDVQLFLVDASSAVVRTAWGRPWEGGLRAWGWQPETGSTARCTPPPLTDTAGDEDEQLAERLW